MGEVGGVVRLECARVGAGLRLHDPKTLKIFTSGNGNASKVEVVDDAVAKWGEWFDFMAYPTDVKEEGVRSDMADAYALARMGLMERWVRGGEVGLVELPEEERSIFTRITKTNPVGLAARTYALYPSARLAAIAAGTKR